jgi:predicted benzoate:H+ symporter BenE
VDLRNSLDDLDKRKFLTLPGFELRLLGRPVFAIPTTLSRLFPEGILLKFCLENTTKSGNNKVLDGLSEGDKLSLQWFFVYREIEN